MLVKVRVSAEQKKGLETIVRSLQPQTIDCKISKDQKGKYMKAYLTLSV